MGKGRTQNDGTARERPRSGRPGPVYRVGEVARAAGLSRQTLHQYVLLGLVRPLGRTPGGHRYFTSRVFRRLDEIQALKRSRTLSEIRDLFAARQRTSGRSGREA